MTRSRLALLGISIVSLLIGIKPASGVPAAHGDWPKFQFDPGNSGFNRFESIIDRTNVGRLAEAWAEGIVSSSPAVAAGVVYMGQQAFTASDGAVVWTAPVNVFNSVDAVSGGVVYLGSDSGGLYAVDAATGTVDWKGPTASIEYSSPLVAGSLVYVQASNGILSAFPTACTNPCPPTWTSDLGNDESSPALAGGVLYADANGALQGAGTLYALNPASGNVLWTAEPPGKVSTSPTVVGGVVYVGNGDLAHPFTISAYPAACSTPCQPLWSAEAGAAVRRIAVAGRTIFAAVGSNLLKAFDAASGKLLWETTTGSSNGIAGSPAVANGLVYEAGGDGFFYAFDTGRGRQLFKADVSNCNPGCVGPIYASAAVSNGMVFVRGADQRLHAYHLGP